MPTMLAELVSDLTTDYGDNTLEPVVAERAVIRALAFLNADLQLQYEAAGDPKMIEPEMNGFHRELLLLRALGFLVRVKRNAASASISYRSGDKEVSRSASNWTDLEKDILEEYWRRVEKINPDARPEVMTPDLAPLPYELESERK